MNTTSNNGGPAFPIAFRMNEQIILEDGISVRDYFAGQALAGYLAYPFNPNHQPEEVANACYQISDAMLAARKEASK